MAALCCLSSVRISSAASLVADSALTLSIQTAAADSIKKAADRRTALRFIVVLPRLELFNRPTRSPGNAWR